jgi:hypothetical protein
MHMLPVKTAAPVQPRFFAARRGPEIFRKIPASFGSEYLLSALPGFFHSFGQRPHHTEQSSSRSCQKRPYHALPDPASPEENPENSQKLQISGTDGPDLKEKTQKKQRILFQ